MKDEDEFPWSQVLGFLFLLFLGVSVPFWMEYRNRSAPPAKRSLDLREDVAGEPLLLDAMPAPARGAPVAFPTWISTSTGRGGSPRP
jgi:hypothetical protein